jgi:hypothetical protein
VKLRVYWIVRADALETSELVLEAMDGSRAVERRDDMLAAASGCPRAERLEPGSCRRAFDDEGRGSACERRGSGFSLRAVPSRVTDTPSESSAGRVSTGRASAGSARGAERGPSDRNNAARRSKNGPRAGASAACTACVGETAAEENIERADGAA